VIQIRVWIPDQSIQIFYFLHHCEIGDCWTFVSISRTINSWFVPYLVTWLKPTFATNPVDIQIRINPKIQIRILDHLRLTFWHWWRFALSECSCFYHLLVMRLPGQTDRWRHYVLYQSVCPIRRLPNSWIWYSENRLTDFDTNWHTWSTRQGHETINFGDHEV